MDQVYVEATRATADSNNLRDWAVAALGVLLKHPWCTPLLATHGGTGPGAAAYADLLLKALDSAGVPREKRSAALAAVGIYVMGAAQQLTAWKQAGSPLDVPAAPEASSLSDFLSDASLDVDAQVHAGLDLILEALTRDRQG